MYRILALDGGGVRGIVPAVILAELEARTKRPVAELFDLVAATSTGAIVGLALLRPGADGKPARTAREVANFYESVTTSVFRRTWAQRIESGGGFLKAKYKADALERELQREFGDINLSSAVRDVLITSYDLRAREPYLFKSRLMQVGTQGDQPMWLVARSTSAAPTYFRPRRVTDGGRELFLVDGGVVANNPAMCAYAEARRLMQDAKIARQDITVLSIGTGAIAFDYASPSTLEGGNIAWAKPLFDIVLDGQEDAVDYQMSQLLRADRYFRLQANLPEYVGKERTQVNQIDNASRRNIRRLKQAALQLISDQKARIREIADRFQPNAGAER